MNKQDLFEPLVLEHHVRVRAFVRSLGVAPDWVDDIAQEAFMTAYREWSSFDPSKDFGKWVRGIAANIVRNEIRKNARRQRIIHSSLAQLLLARQDEVKEQQSNADSLVAIRACLAELSPTNLQVIQARYRDGTTAKELATTLQRSAASVRQMLVRIRRQIRKCVELRLAGDIA